ncbi:MAG: translation initiation factor IF-3 [Candidatus Kerfeldbacteria bacterium RIFCSPHIGHO2_12_FULL_48_17]|uniref:Translation initiation factor IF-3 n=1 Tax=Candidatus Kerfeldbacteria bacterium RIFCSPHIGHO2_12_FULL_48_17 TaxID=1798542 RepID=A0A1G2B5V8_9BACT|nr:MAG: translation initiation factor IF-3 [Candidatus Kerfeldbacteria bacterium RIFCSPHIGHO2_12_FULL_48_17]
MSSKKFPVNGGIRAPQVFLIDDQGQRVGVVPLHEAMRLAQEKHLDLVAVSPRSEPPVCKIIDFGRFMYKQDKEDRKTRARGKKTELKGIRLTLKMGAHDEDVRRKQAQKFLDNGDKVKIEMILRGREKARVDMAVERIEAFRDSLEGNVAAEDKIGRQGGRLSVTIYKK